MKLDKIALKSFYKRMAASVCVMVPFLLIMDNVPPFTYPFDLTIGDMIITGAWLIWGMYALLWTVEANHDTRERMGLKRNWNNTEIDNLEARIEKLERERP